jgi:2-dehydropantoate 2-reductase
MRLDQKSIIFIGTGANGSSIASDIIDAGFKIKCYDQWPDNVEAIKKNGFTINTPDEVQNTKAQALHLCQLAETIKKFDIVLMALKSYDTKWGCEMIKPYLAEDGVLIGIQNGMTAETIASYVGVERTLGCVVELSSEMTEPGIVQRNTSKKKTWFGLGTLDNINNRHFEDVKKLLNCAGRVSISKDILSAKWMKLLVNSMSLGPFALLGLPVQEGLNTPGMRELVLAIGDETMSLGHELSYNIEPIMGLSEGVMNESNRLPETLLDTLVEHIGPSARDCILQDMLKGRRTEIDMINGLVVEELSKLGRVAPYNAAVMEVGNMIVSGELSPKPENINILKKIIRRKLDKIV